MLIDPKGVGIEVLSDLRGLCSAPVRMMCYGLFLMAGCNYAINPSALRNTPPLADYLVTDSRHFDVGKHEAEKRNIQKIE
ncbi:MAG: hypothetical protein QS748_11365 [Candidatus Endonucleobacter bathymodioli]|uniref:Uncharacterized protein n=1 Tax=Candidatus Endonucleibacter bathymodioli TaxID=539814 RepID=A0AA90NSH7_9GAMM|nr:hypothetical protein [Candidatus Endonucleobacter bathymodioli]